MVCEFLPREYKQKLVDMATLQDLLEVGYSVNSVYKMKQKKAISDEKCEELVKVLGDKARPVVLDAFQAFANEVGIPVNTNNVNVDVSQLLRAVENKIRSVFEDYFGKPKTTADFERVYDFVKDDLGLASIKDIREQLGMTLEQFMNKFRDYIIQNYELHAGGKEGIVKGGILYGIIRRKKD